MPQILPDCSSSLSHSSLATAGSAGIDLITQEEIEFKIPLEVKIVPSQFKGFLPSGLVGLILPRSFAHKKGCFVVPGVIDSDYTALEYSCFCYKKEKWEMAFPS
uniref:dUTPase-like domain-containing protein n=1 Tax=Pseudonaja textilis TaxID=8673 RepID=A0A670XQA9_PSETE